MGYKHGDGMLLLLTIVVGWCAPSDGLLLFSTANILWCSHGDGLLFLPNVGVGQCTISVDMLPHPYFFLDASEYWLNSWLLGCMLMLVSMGVGCWGFFVEIFWCMYWCVCGFG